jgi:hypothetical protein
LERSVKTLLRANGGVDAEIRELGTPNRGAVPAKCELSDGGPGAAGTTILRRRSTCRKKEGPSDPARE